MKVNFDDERGINKIIADDEDKNYIRVNFTWAGLILGGMLYESDFNIDKLDSLDLIGVLLEAARFEYNWRYHHER